MSTPSRVMNGNDAENSIGITLALKLGKIFENSGIDHDWKLQKLHADILDALLAADEENEFIFATTISAENNLSNPQIEDGVLPIINPASPGGIQNRPFSSPVYRKVLSGNTGISDETNHVNSPSSLPRRTPQATSPTANDINGNTFPSSKSKNTNPLVSGNNTKKSDESSSQQQNQHVALNTLPDGLSVEGIETHNLLLRNLLQHQAKKFQTERTALMRENAILRSQAFGLSHGIVRSADGTNLPPVAPLPSSSSNPNDDVDSLEQAVINQENLIKEVEKHRESTHEFKRKLGTETKRRTQEVSDLSRRLAEVQMSRTAEREDMKQRLTEGKKLIESAAKREGLLSRDNNRLRDEVNALHGAVEKHRVVSQALDVQLIRARSDIDSLVENSNKQLALHQEQIVALKQEARSHTRLLEKKCSELARKGVELARRLELTEQHNQQMLLQRRQSASGMFRRQSMALHGSMRLLGGKGGAGSDDDADDASAANGAKNRMPNHAAAAVALSPQQQKAEQMQAHRLQKLEDSLFEKQNELDAAKFKLEELEQELDDAKNDNTNEMLLKETERQLQAERERMKKAIADMQKTEQELRNALKTSLDESDGKLIKKQQQKQNPTSSKDQRVVNAMSKSVQDVIANKPAWMDDDTIEDDHNHHHGNDHEGTDFSTASMIDYVTNVVNKTTGCQTDPVKFADRTSSAGKKSSDKNGSGSRGKSSGGSPPIRPKSATTDSSKLTGAASSSLLEHQQSVNEMTMMKNKKLEENHENEMKKKSTEIAQLEEKNKKLIKDVQDEKEKRVAFEKELEKQKKEHSEELKKFLLGTSFADYSSKKKNAAPKDSDKSNMVVCAETQTENGQQPASAPSALDGIWKKFAFLHVGVQTDSNNEQSSAPFDLNTNNNIGDGLIIPSSSRVSSSAQNHQTQQNNNNLDNTSLALTSNKSEAISRDVSGGLLLAAGGTNATASVQNLSFGVAGNNQNETNNTSTSLSSTQNNNNFLVGSNSNQYDQHQHDPVETCDVGCHPISELLEMAKKEILASQKTNNRSSSSSGSPIKRMGSAGIRKKDFAVEPTSAENSPQESVIQQIEKKVFDDKLVQTDPMIFHHPLSSGRSSTTSSRLVMNYNKLNSQQKQISTPNDPSSPSTSSFAPTNFVNNNNNNLIENDDGGNKINNNDDRNQGIILGSENKTRSIAFLNSKKSQQHQQPWSALQPKEHCLEIFGSAAPLSNMMREVQEQSNLLFHGVQQDYSSTPSTIQQQQQEPQSSFDSAIPNLVNHMQRGAHYNNTSPLRRNNNDNNNESQRQHNSPEHQFHQQQQEYQQILHRSANSAARQRKLREQERQQQQSQFSVLEAPRIQTAEEEEAFKKKFPFVVRDSHQGFNAGGNRNDDNDESEDNESNTAWKGVERVGNLMAKNKRNYESDDNYDQNNITHGMHSSSSISRAIRDTMNEIIAKQKSAHSSLSRNNSPVPVDRNYDGDEQPQNNNNNNYNFSRGTSPIPVLQHQQEFNNNFKNPPPHHHHPPLPVSAVRHLIANSSKALGKNKKLATSSSSSTFIEVTPQIAKQQQDEINNNHIVSPGASNQKMSKPPPAMRNHSQNPHHQQQQLQSTQETVPNSAGILPGQKLFWNTMEYNPNTPPTSQQNHDSSVCGNINNNNTSHSISHSIPMTKGTKHRPSSSSTTSGTTRNNFNSSVEMIMMRQQQDLVDKIVEKRNSPVRLAHHQQFDQEQSLTYNINNNHNNSMHNVVVVQQWTSGARNENESATKNQTDEGEISFTSANNNNTSTSGASAAARNMMYHTPSSAHVRTIKQRRSRQESPMKRQQTSARQNLSTGDQEEFLMTHGSHVANPNQHNNNDESLIDDHHQILLLQLPTASSQSNNLSSTTTSTAGVRGLLNLSSNNNNTNIHNSSTSKGNKTPSPTRYYGDDDDVYARVKRDREERERQRNERAVFTVASPTHDDIDVRETLRAVAVIHSSSSMPLSTKEMNALATVEKAARNRKVAQFLTTFDPALFRPQKKSNFQGAQLKRN